ncbi:2-amino-4-hydroxy-6- hydroxymethyldihydropteridine pyrophosphokinase FolK [Phaeobacter piscinae]|uniref:2-amino-4-hydroxy-6-hydroxymethyldihydropteridine pyrophosphokinase n=1 Tax=Phaeobacter piscinae TaxID=1580596 RepID=A0ABM6PGA9_9RHOB|nr:2-amino-4-hydroxy-6-hydroxymethyldihydropteridine diphosphokinase [Phaeobacter piscinae]ATG37067.1 2-amino-4-hydroxy-6- hydroxymethyldihydropteridine pyrophosphokinase FolK [Phaeobacter piscinae]AUQ87588.1 2-amino-4-hydroxy-6- hydroxymethyldihydropteridine pyrophosphokinase FolK [Phaeobacter piscinae]AUR25471.1 2-amino-4-hydroxy-6- hydroxymethyldihydropteridine pyrophosphokinase FolK [Phaeobacter piscinae]
MTEIRSEAFIAMGGNLPIGEQSVVHTLIGAVEQLSESDIRLSAVSRFYRTPCFPAGSGPDYVNAAIAIRTNLSPRALLDLLHQVEADFARRRLQRWGMRTLDLDLIAYDDLICPDVATFERWKDLPLDQQMQEAPGQMLIPHPRLQDRGFVLVPLRDIAPDWRHPILGQTVRELCAALPMSDLSEISPV